MATARERNLIEAGLHGYAVILLLIAATLTAVGAIMAACGCGLWCVLIGAPVLLPAAALELAARYARRAFPALVRHLAASLPEDDRDGSSRPSHRTDASRG